MRIVTTDGIALHVEEAGKGPAVVFIHEFGGDHRSWEPQIRYFSRRCRCVTFAARGYPPSDVPATIDAYSQDRATDDVVDVMDGLGIARAHIVGLSMGGFAALHLGLRYPARACSLTIAGAGYGCEKRYEAHFRATSLQVADGFEMQGAHAFAEIYALGPSRVQFQNKDPRGWREFADRLAEHSACGAALTMRGVQARRPSFHDFEDELTRMTEPTLIVVGDEDDHCLEPGLFLKRVVPTAGLAVLPKAGHTLNLEEPEAFNRLLSEFFAAVDAGSWAKRDPRAIGGEIMRTH